jgi:MHS family proline/betaine transporter-like MFS transporter
MSEMLNVEVDQGLLTKVLLAAAIGNFVEWFDFGIYGFLATTLAHEFFPGGDQTVALIKTFAVFAVAFALRPLGAVVFGMIGDRIGRKRTLAITILLMAGATTLCGLLPTYAQIGIFAPLLLTLTRSIQGFSTGGEYAGACAYVMEHAPHDQRGRYGSFLPVSTFGSFAVAAIVAFALSATLSHADMNSWGWRIPFLAAAPIGLIGLYLRLNLDETPAFQALDAEQARTHAPLREAVLTQWPAMLRLGAFISLTALAFYTFTTYLSTYMQVTGHLSHSDALLSTVVALVFAAAICPFIGRFTDFVGRRKTMLTAAASLILLVYPALMLARSGVVALAVAGALLLAIGAAIANVVTAPLLSEVFPTRTRYTASAVTYNFAYTIFGGTAPLVATYLIAVTGDNAAPALYLLAIAVFALAGGLMLPETGKVSLDDIDSTTDSPPCSATS